MALFPKTTISEFNLKARTMIWIIEVYRTMFILRNVKIDRYWLACQFGIAINREAPYWIRLICVINTFGRLHRNDSMTFDWVTVTNKFLLISSGSHSYSLNYRGYFVANNLFMRVSITTFRVIAHGDYHFP